MSDAIQGVLIVLLALACFVAVPLGLAFLLTYVAPAVSFAVIFWWALAIESVLTLGAIVFGD